MKLIYVFLLSVTLQSQYAFADGINFFKGTFEEAKELANKEGRLIFVDAYTTWCGPCKRMSSNVFTKDDVGSFYNEQFINLKLDMEKGEGRKFQQKYRVSAFPTLLFISPDGKIVHKVVGGMDVPNFLKLGKFAASKSGVDSELDNAYKDGQRDPAFMAKYVQSLSKSNKPRLKIVNEYLKSQNDLSTPENLAVLFYGTEEADSRIFNNLVKHKKKVIAQFGQEALDKQIEKAAKKTVKKGIEFGNVDLVEEGIDKVSRYSTIDSKVFAGQSRMTFYASLKEWDHYLKNAKEYAKIGTAQKFELANTILHKMKGESSLLPWGEKWAVEASTEESNEHHHFTAAKYCLLNGKHKKAKTHAELALQHAEKEQSATVPHIQKLLNSVNEKLEISKS